MNISRLLARATRNLRSAGLLLADHDHSGACNRVYYGAFDAAKAGLLAMNTTADVDGIKTHSGLIQAFGLHLVKTGLVSRDSLQYHHGSRLRENRPDRRRSAKVGLHARLPSTATTGMARYLTNPSGRAFADASRRCDPCPDPSLGGGPRLGRHPAKFPPRPMGVLQRVPRDLGKILSRLEHTRMLADYADADVKAEHAATALEQGEEFVEAMRQLVTSGQRLIS